jgi:hypothetical protein
MRTKRKRDEVGTVAIIAAVSSLTVFGIAAMAVDLGNAFARARDVQAQADFAALGAGRHLPVAESDRVSGAVYATMSPSAQAAIDEVVDYLNANQPLDEDGKNCPGEPECITADGLTDGLAANGEVTFPSVSKMRVLTPPALVRFGLGQVLGVSNVDVAKAATVGLGSPGKTLPFYIGESCAYGSQQIQDPASGHNASTTPTLVPASSLTYKLNNFQYDDGTDAYTTDAGSGDPVTLHITTTTNNGFSLVDAIGFTQDVSEGGTHVQIDNSAGTLFTILDGKNITFSVPATVLDTSGVWYVRVHRPVDGWSAANNNKQLPIIVIGSGELGSSSATCGDDVSGNFGSLRLSRDDAVNADWLAMNIALGLQHGLTTFADGPTPCDNAAGEAAGAVLDSGTPDQDIIVNCLMTDPGLVSPATKGMIAGINGNIGLLAVPGNIAGHPHSTTLNPAGNSDTRLVNFTGKGSYYINNDALTAFFLNSTVTVGNVTQQIDLSASLPAIAEHAIGSEIFASPRFFWIPVLSYDAAHGHSTGYPIVRFQPAFITGQPTTATKTAPNPSGFAMPDNGVFVDKNSIESLQVVLIDPDALPESIEAHGSILPWLGAGTKIIQLID